jgi:uncharacterized protein (DUF4213/DUF364 family)
LNINDLIYDAVSDRGNGCTTADVRIGLGYTAVMLDNGSVGLAYTFRKEAADGCTAFRGKRPLVGKPANELLAYLKSDDVVEAAVGLAAANALSNLDRDNLVQGDLLEAIALGAEDSVGMVGFFAPLIASIKKRAKSLIIFERNQNLLRDMQPQKSMEEALPQCDVAIITSTAILNHTIDRILDLSASCREVVMLGASTPLLDDIVYSTPVTCLSGVVVRRPGDILQIVSEGGGMRMFGDSVSKMSLMRPKEHGRNES